MTPATGTRTAPHNWHPADIVAALRKKNWSLRQLALAQGLHRGTLAKALRHPYPRAEHLIASALGLQPEQIWPERYDANGQPNRRRGGVPIRPTIPSTATADPAPLHPRPRTRAG